MELTGGNGDETALLENDARAVEIAEGAIGAFTEATADRRAAEHVGSETGVASGGARAGGGVRRIHAARLASRHGRRIARAAEVVLCAGVAAAARAEGAAGAGVVAEGEVAVVAGEVLA